MLEYVRMLQKIEYVCYVAYALELCLRVRSSVRDKTERER